MKVLKVTYLDGHTVNYPCDSVNRSRNMTVGSIYNAIAVNPSARFIEVSDTCAINTALICSIEIVDDPEEMNNG